ncbi:MAG: hypothetical protein AAB150_01850 [Pseudomonadota bacterium]
MTLALFQLAQIVGLGKETIAFGVIKAFEPRAYILEQQVQQAADFGVALNTRNLLDRMNIKSGFVRGLDLDIAAHNLGRGRGRPENPQGRLA